MSVTQRRWTEEEIVVLHARHSATIAPAIIAEELGRSLHSVQAKLDQPYRRKRDADLRERFGTPSAKLDCESYTAPPPAFVIRERDIRRSISRTTVTACIFADPVKGYSALDNKRRKLSVQDALEICAAYTGRRGEISGLAQFYGVSPQLIQSVVNGTFFEKLKPAYRCKHEAL